MRYLLLGVMLLVSSVAFAQQVVPLQGSLNPHVFRLAQRAPLYRHLRDTLTNSTARRLHSGDEVIIFNEGSQQRSRWLKVVRGDGTGTNFSKDTASYYLPAWALKGAKIFVLL
jgi:hypothetical protein